MTIHRAMLRTSLAAVLLILAACAAPAGNPTTPPASVVAATGVAPSAATVNSTTAATSAVATTSPGGDRPEVDLTFTGDVPVVAKGSNGDCELGHGADGSVIGFGFLASESDYAGLGDSFNITEDLASHKVSVKWIVADTFFAGVFPSGVTVSPDHHAVVIDADIPAGVGRTEHLRGSITCP